MNDLFKKTYVLLLFERNPSIPIECRGHSAKHYGHYMYERGPGTHNAHVLRVDAEKWENGASKDIMRKFRRTAAPTVHVEVEPTEKLLAILNEFDAVKAQLAVSTSPDQAKIMGLAIAKLLDVPGAPNIEALRQQIEADLVAEAAALQAAREAAQATPDAFDELGAAAEPAASATAPAEPSADPLRASLEVKTHRDLRAECQGLNKRGANIPLTNPTKAQMVDSLHAYYATHPADLKAAA